MNLSCYLGFMRILDHKYIIRCIEAAHNRSGRKVVSIEGYARAAVLVPMIQTLSGFELLFTRRTEEVETHKGQISFPGGMCEPDDPDLVSTALREAREEVGIPGDHIKVVGLLDDLATPTGFVITPVVGIVGEGSPIVPNSDEVAEVFRVPLEFFAVAENGRMETREHGGRSYSIWFFDTGTHVIWGATAAIVRSLLIILRMA